MCGWCSFKEHCSEFGGTVLARPVDEHASGPSSTGTWSCTTRTVHPAVSADLAPVLESSIAKHDAVSAASANSTNVGAQSSGL